MSTTLYRKYRPQAFADVVGQKHIVRTLTNALKHDRLGQAYLFTGPRGTGKTTTARLLAKAANCLGREEGSAEPCLACAHCTAMAENRSLDVIEIDAASNTGVDNIRELRETVKLPPTLAPHKVYIIDEVHMLSAGAFNALLKTLEEPPKHVIFILATTALHKVPDTIVSRCQRFDFARFPVDQIVAKLAKIAETEGVKVEPAALEMVALAAEGGMRDAESLLTQVVALEDKEVTAEEVASILGITEQQKVEQLLRHLADRDLRASLLLINRLVENGSDLYVFCNSLLHSLRQTLLLSIDPKLGQDLSSELTQEQAKALADLAQTLGTGSVLTLLDLFQAARKDIRTATLPQLPLEIAAVKFIAGPSATSGTPSAPTGPTIPPANPRPTPSGIKIASAPTNHSQETIDTRPTPSQPNEKAQENPRESFRRSPAERSEGKATEKRAPEGFPPATGTDSANAPSDQEKHPTQKEPMAPFTLDDVRHNWHAVMDKAKAANASLALALLNCQPLRLEGNAIVLGVKFSFHKEKLNTAENRLTVETAFDTILKAKTKVQVVVDENASPSPETAPPADNPLLAEALSILGGRVVG
jgi:DNA polymerase-3 subunit gamma/tau